MISTLRYWGMALTLLGAILGLHFLPHGRDVALVRPLNSVPLIFSEWHGVDAPFDQSMVKALEVDDYLNRVYRGQDDVPIGLYVAYYKSQRTSERLHSPQNCLPGTGWQPMSAGYAQLENPNGETVMVNRYIIQKGADRQVVLYWYQSHGRTIANEYKARIDMIVDAIRLQRTDAALIRINTSLTSSMTDERLVSFAVAVLGQLGQIIPN
jgi:EpsI family protein